MSKPSSYKLARTTPESLQGNPRASFAAWKRYEPIVLAAFAQHPRPYIYQPTSMSATTVASRLRDAIRGAIAFEHQNQIPADLFRSWFTEIIIKQEGEQVYIGPPGETAQILEGSVPQKTRDLCFDSLSFEEIVAFCILLSTGRLHGPVKIQHPPDISVLPERQNVEILPREDGSLVLL